MAPCDALVFAGITPERFVELAARAKSAAGIDMHGNAGSASQFGVEVTWNYDPARQELILQCMRAGFLGCKAVNARIRSAIEGGG